MEVWKESRRKANNKGIWEEPGKAAHERNGENDQKGSIREGEEKD